MTTVSWLAVVVLGPGALLVFVWFLFDVRGLLDGTRNQSDDGSGGASDHARAARQADHGEGDPGAPGHGPSRDR